MKNNVTLLLKTQLQKLYEMDFYKNKLDQAGILPADVNSLDDFKKIPFTSTTELLDELSQKPSMCSLYSKDVTRINFSPSAGDLYPIYHTNNDLMRMHDVSASSLEAAGITKKDICAVTFGYHLFVAGLFYQNQLEHYGAKVIPLGPGESQRAAEIINKFQVTVLISNPTFAMKLARIGIPDVKTLFVGGEPFTSVDGYPEKLQAVFNKEITVIDSYSMASCLPIARSCRFETGLHILDDFLYAEVIDPLTGENVPLGKNGELVLTHLHKEAAPLLRYRTGDLTFMEVKKCDCGRSVTLPRSVFGRTDEMLKIKGVKFWPSQIGTVLHGFEELTKKYRIHVWSEKDVDRLELTVEGRKLSTKRLSQFTDILKKDTLLSFNRITIVDTLDEGSMVIDDRKGRTF